MSHGSGGRMTKDLIDTVFAKHFRNSALAKGNDFADLLLPDGNQHRKLIVSTDAHIVSPIFFPGGDIGKLSICGTVNDLAVKGAKPIYVAVSFVIQEGISLKTLDKLCASIANTAKSVNVPIVTGDTKVIEKRTDAEASKKRAFSLEIVSSGVLVFSWSISLVTALDGSMPEKL
jgi:hydrogenase expression/formation protein HypE